MRLPLYRAANTRRSSRLEGGQNLTLSQVLPLCQRELLLVLVWGLVVGLVGLVGLFQPHRLPLLLGVGPKLGPISSIRRALKARFLLPVWALLGA